MTKRLLLSLCLLFLGLVACSGEDTPDTPDTPTAEVVTITLGNIGSEAWYTLSVEGAEGVSELGEENANAVWNLSVGTRYQIINATDDDPSDGFIQHPFELRNPMGEALTSQLNAGSLEADTSINYEEAEDGSSVTFTLTQELADLVDTYYCTYHSGMEGEINAQ